MTKTELITDLESKYYAVRTPIPKTYGDMIDLETKFYGAECVTIAGSFLSRKTIDFYVYREGEANEAAFYAGNESSQFLAKVNAYIKTKVADSTIVSAYKKNIDPENRSAYYIVIRDIAGTYTEEYYNIKQNADDSWELKKIG